MTKQRHCFVTQVGDAIEALASALDPEREPPFKGDILDLLEWAEKDVLAMRAEIVTMKYEKFEAGNNQTIFVVRISELHQQVTLLRGLLARYRNETPVGNQPHMICHEVDEAIAATEPKP